MKIRLLLFIITISAFTYSQNSNIEYLDFADHKIIVPKNCSVKSETKIICDGTSTQWFYLENELKGMGNILNEQLINQFKNSSEFKSMSKISLNSFDSKLNGYKFYLQKENSDIYFITLTGELNNKQVMIYIGSKKDINNNSDLNELQKKILSF